jgi:hypothetical protein
MRFATSSTVSFWTRVPQFGQNVCPMRANSSRKKSKHSVDVATVERGLRVVFFWRMATAGAIPSISSTSGFSMRSRNCRAYADSDST